MNIPMGGGENVFDISDFELLNEHSCRGHLGLTAKCRTSLKLFESNKWKI